MSTTDLTGGPAFPFCRKSVADMEAPFEHHEGDAGMSLRDWFAGKALEGLCTIEPPAGYMPDDTAEYAYELANAMIRERLALITGEQPRSPEWPELDQDQTKECPR